MAIAHVALVHYAIAITYIYIILIYFIKATFINNGDCSCSACTLRNRHRLHLCRFNLFYSGIFLYGQQIILIYYLNPLCFLFRQRMCRTCFYVRLLNNRVD